MKSKGIYASFFKRLFDILISGLFLICFCWLYAILAILVRNKLGKPAIFCQERPGKDGKIFKLYKFRSMSNEKDKDGNLLPDEQRITDFGRKLRATSLDELPQMWNILKGDMSIIGPRPLLVKYLPYYTAEEGRRHEVRPGVTGYAQVHGRNHVNWEERFKLDVYYVDNVSLMMDIKVIIDTIKVVLSHDDVVLNYLVDFDEYRRNQMEN